MTSRALTWREEKDEYLARGAVTAEDAEALHARFSSYFEVEFPSPINQQRFRFRSCGYVGTFRASDDLMVRVVPKVPIASLFRLLEYAYDLRSFRIDSGTVEAATVDDLFETLALMLARRVLDRMRRGLHRDYIEHEEELSFVRGRLCFRETLRQSLSGTPRLACAFDEHTAELEDNHILAWTLDLIGRMPIEREDVAAAVRRASRTLRRTVEPQRVSTRSCVRRFYHRLNQDYQPMHALCRFFLEQCGPRLDRGDHSMVPFSLHMPSLFETFVERWLVANLDQRWQVDSQYRADLDGEGHLFFRIDLVIRDRQSGEVAAVLDTKYKDAAHPKQEDIQQIVAYATRMRSGCAVLVYPSQPARPAIAVGDVSVRLLGFDLGRDLEDAGEAFRAALMAAICIPPLAGLPSA